MSQGAPVSPIFTVRLYHSYIIHSRPILIINIIGYVTMLLKDIKQSALYLNLKS